MVLGIKIYVNWHENKYSIKSRKLDLFQRVKYLSLIKYDANKYEINVTITDTLRHLTYQIPVTDTKAVQLKRNKNK